MHTHCLCPRVTLYRRLRLPRWTLVAVTGAASPAGGRGAERPAPPGSAPSCPRLHPAPGPDTRRRGDTVTPSVTCPCTPQVCVETSDMAPRAVGPATQPPGARTRSAAACRARSPAARARSLHSGRGLLLVRHPRASSGPAPPGSGLCPWPAVSTPTPAPAQRGTGGGAASRPLLPRPRALGPAAPSWARLWQRH